MPVKCTKGPPVQTPGLVSDGTCEPPPRTYMEWLKKISMSYFLGSGQVCCSCSSCQPRDTCGYVYFSMLNGVHWFSFFPLQLIFLFVIALWISHWGSVEPWQAVPLVALNCATIWLSYPELCLSEACAWCHDEVSAEVYFETLVSSSILLSETLHGFLLITLEHKPRIIIEYLSVCLIVTHTYSFTTIPTSSPSSGWVALKLPF